MPAPIVTVTQLDSYIKGIFDAEELLHNIRVEGEVSDCSVKSNNAYFTLKDRLAQIGCCCFSVSRTLTPKDGDQIIVTGRPDFYPKNGRLSFLVDRIEQKGVGTLFAEFLLLKEKLAAEGLFAEERKIPLPPVIKNLCVVTSHQGAVVRDILSTVKKTTECMKITVADVRVQGVGAAESIINALFLADEAGFDAVILARGGGSFEDLMPFNTEEVARAVGAMRTPVISAVGHETDFSLSDFAADFRALTPTAAAELVAEGWRRRDAEFAALKGRLFAAVGAVLKNADGEIRYGKERMSSYVDRIFKEKESDYQSQFEKLNALSPEAILKNGFFAAEKDGLRIKSVREIAVGDEITLIFPDGTAKASVKNKENYR